jgi:glucose/arabinose dehydrogenase
MGILPFVGSSAFVQEQQKTTPEESTSNAGSPLRRYKITTASLPPPNPGMDADNPPRVIPRPPDAELHLPPGFEVSTFAEGDFKFVRWMALAPNGDVFVSDAELKKIIILRDTNNDGKADTRFVFASNLDLPFGLAFWKNYLYVGATNAVLRFSYKAGQVEAQGSPEKIADLPGRGYRQHWTRNVIFDPSGKKLYVTVGSESNVSVEKEPQRATISEYNPDGSGHRIFASGLRNPVGLAFHPTTKRLWATVQERDRLGDDLPPDYLTEVQEDGFYGWPYSYIGKNEDPRRKGERTDLVNKAIVPEVLIQAHSAVLGLVFYNGGMFPREYRGDAFIALHGSWNRTKRTGYKIIRVPLKNNRLVGDYEDFLAGWMLDENRREVWGRPAGLLVLKDGSMLVSDDGANKVWRVTYRNKKR